MKQVLLVFACSGIFSLYSCANDTATNKGSNGIISYDNSLSLPANFKAQIVVAELGRNRHIAVNSNGDVFVKLEKLLNGKGIVQLRPDKNGIYKEINSFCNYTGTGIVIKKGYLYASSDEDVFRYKFNANNEIENPEAPEKLVTGLVNKRQHASKAISLDNDGNIYVEVGAPSNACQEKDRQKGSPGMEPCPILETAGGIWQFKVDKLNQTYADGVHYVTGIRHVVGMDWNNASNDLYLMQHGRDQLSQFFPDMYSNEQNAEIPAEEFFRAKKGSDFGWPYCFFDPFQNKKLLSPEYGGDGKVQGRCADKGQPIMAFPGHWAPNDLMFYTGNQFPAKYKNGAFIAFHGSWNRAPLKQAGYNVVFVPFGEDGLPNGEYEIFATGFMGKESIVSPGDAAHRPCGLSQGPDGSIYISDSKMGTIWKITYNPK